MSRVEHVQELIDSEGYSGWELIEAGFEVLDHILLSHGRWTIFCLDVLADEEGHVFGIVYDVPATELQEGSEGYTSVVPVTTTESWITA
jgi:hypothetical protein